MTGLLVTYWPGRPVTILAIAYEPPRRARRVAPPSLRAPSTDADWLTRLAEMIDLEAGR